MENKGNADNLTQACSSNTSKLSDRQHFSTHGQIADVLLSQLFNSDGFRDQQQKHQENPNSETNLANKEADCRDCNVIDVRSELDLGAERITDDSGSQDDKVQKCIESAGVKPTPEAENTGETTDSMSKVPLLASSSSRQNTVGHDRELGSSSFSAASTPSGRLTFSGLVSRSDSISLRSNSTTSTRSFAFPILATEWDQSPIRMAEVDRRRPTKCGCWRWRVCFTCSKF